MWILDEELYASANQYCVKMLSYVNIICQIDILTSRSQIPVLLKFERDMNNISLSTKAKEHS